ncbi:MAG: radical SAM protein [Firmicutes bacterium]|nr:radical SAM protein [Bacillota bacterium]
MTRAVEQVGFAPTHRCNLKCKHCYLGPSENVNMDPDIPLVTMEYFNDISHIGFYGAESQFNPQAPLDIKKAALTYDRKFKGVGLVSNLTFLNYDFWDTVEELGALATSDGYKVHVRVSNDAEHNRAMRAIGIYKQQVYDNIRLLQDRYPSIYVELEDWTKNSPVINSGNATALIEQGLAEQIDESELEKMAIQRCMQRMPGHYIMKRKLNFFRTDAKGNVHDKYVDHITGDKVNFGNVLQTPIPEILLSL